MASIFAMILEEPSHMKCAYLKQLSELYFVLFTIMGFLIWKGWILRLLHGGVADTIYHNFLNAIENNAARANWVMSQIERYVADMKQVRGLGFLRQYSAC